MMSVEHQDCPSKLVVYGKLRPERRIKARRRAKGKGSVQINPWLGTAGRPLRIMDQKKKPCAPIFHFEGKIQLGAHQSSRIQKMSLT